ncbi:hypothetical protein GYMLUDRAFT_247624 [Collybiopsis luxurians FD-317 M1]|uniref:Uncharacterized protein n=1 Tax=Collybiopsis luxurians FD-317 M1 TaxID=944289 RepID=A0A0D0CMW4_9AGAR|nr:hypothetical protein GYMLUDRAFT_247624 [Collybiopsis luxurians FD-317 M1]
MASDVIVQEFEGSTRKQQLEETLHWIPHSLNPYLLQPVGTSPPSISDRNPHYIVYKGVYKLNPRRLIASLLAERDRERLASVGSQVVYGIASALDYLSNATTALRLADIGIQNFDIFSDENGRSVVCFTSEPADTERRDAEMNNVVVCNTFITKLFSDANHILHREKLDRINDDVVDAADSRGSSGFQGKDATDASEEIAQNPNSTSCRQEIIWMSRDFNLTLSDMSESYGDLLHLRPPPEGADNRASIALPRHLGKRLSEVQHDCRGYCREEITLTPDAFCNKIWIFSNPSINERCGLCGEIVRLRSDAQPSNQSHESSSSTKDSQDYHTTVEVEARLKETSQSYMYCDFTVEGVEPTSPSLYYTLEDSMWGVATEVESASPSRYYTPEGSVQRETPWVGSTLLDSKQEEYDPCWKTWSVAANDIQATDISFWSLGLDTLLDASLSTQPPAPIDPTKMSFDFPLFPNEDTDSGISAILTTGAYLFFGHCYAPHSSSSVRCYPSWTHCFLHDNEHFPRGLVVVVLQGLVCVVCMAAFTGSAISSNAGGGCSLIKDQVWAEQHIASNRPLVVVQISKRSSGERPSGERPS